MIVVQPLETIEANAVEGLLDRAFGIDRHHRTAYRLREGVTAIAGLSLAATEGGVLLGSVQCWPVRHLADDGTPTPLVLVGPVAVEPAHQQRGIGKTLMEASLAAAAAQGLDGALMLIGDADYYGRFFGFHADASAMWRLPGPVERHRLLARGASVPSGPGAIAPRLSVSA